MTTSRKWRPKVSSTGPSPSRRTGVRTPTSASSSPTLPSGPLAAGTSVAVEATAAGQFEIVGIEQNELDLEAADR